MTMPQPTVVDDDEDVVFLSLNPAAHHRRSHINLSTASMRVIFTSKKINNEKCAYQLFTKHTREGNSSAYEMRWCFLFGSFGSLEEIWNRWFRLNWRQVFGAGGNGCLSEQRERDQKIVLFWGLQVLKFICDLGHIFQSGEVEEPCWSEEMFFFRMKTLNCLT